MTLLPSFLGDSPRGTLIRTGPVSVERAWGISCFIPSISVFSPFGQSHSGWGFRESQSRGVSAAPTSIAGYLRVSKDPRRWRESRRELRSRLMGLQVLTTQLYTGPSESYGDWEPAVGQPCLRVFTDYSICMLIEPGKDSRKLLDLRTLYVTNQQPVCIVTRERLSPSLFLPLGVASVSPAIIRIRGGAE